MIGSIVGAGVGAAASIIGGISAARQARKMERAIKQEQRENTDWYNRRYNEDATQRADAQRLLTMTEDAIKNRNQAAAGTQAVMGGTDASVASTKEANAQGMADTVGRIAADAENRKTDIENRYMQRKSMLDSQLQNIRAQKASATMGAVQGVVGAAGAIGSAIDDNAEANKRLKALQGLSK